jgi:nickel-type superoxide dismutase maturation protease
MRWPIWRAKVAERSMQPALDPGDMLLVRRTIRAGRALPVRAGQIVVARNPRRPEQLGVRRAGRPEGGGWWLSSDNPWAGAVDSKAFGPVPPRLIEGKVLLRYHRGRPAGS